MKKCPLCAQVMQDEARICEFCEWAESADVTLVDPAEAAPSGMGSRSPVPAGIWKRSWFGFWSPILFGIVNHAWGYTVVGVGFVVASFFVPAGMQQAMGYGSFGLSIWAYLYGGHLAWQSRKWDSVEAFKATQRRWMWISFVVSTVVAVLVVWSMVQSLGPKLSSYNAHGVTFSPPQGWYFDKDATRVKRPSGELEWQDAFFQSGRATLTFITVGRQVGGFRVPANLDAVAEKAARSFESESVTLPVGSVVEGTTFPTIQVDDQVEAEGTVIDKRVAVIFADGGAFFVVCQYDEASAAGVLAACDGIVQTFELAP